MRPSTTLLDITERGVGRSAARAQRFVAVSYTSSSGRYSPLRPATIAANPAADCIDLPADGADRHVGARRRHVRTGRPGVGLRVVGFHGREVLAGRRRVDRFPAAFRPVEAPAADRIDLPVDHGRREGVAGSRHVRFSGPGVGRRIVGLHDRELVEPNGRPPDGVDRPAHGAGAEQRRARWACSRAPPTCRWRGHTPEHCRPACCLPPPRPSRRSCRSLRRPRDTTAAGAALPAVARSADSTEADGTAARAQGEKQQRGGDTAGGEHGPDRAPSQRGLTHHPPHADIRSPLRRQDYSPSGAGGQGSWRPGRPGSRVDDGRSRGAQGTRCGRSPIGSGASSNGRGETATAMSMSAEQIRSRAVVILGASVFLSGGIACQADRIVSVLDSSGTNEMMSNTCSSGRAAVGHGKSSRCGGTRPAGDCTSTDGVR